MRSFFFPFQVLLMLVLIAGCEPEEQQQPPPADAATTTVDTLIYACVKGAACGVRAYPRVSDCVNDYKTRVLSKGMGPVYDNIFGCTANAKSCDAVRACHGHVGSCSASDKAICYKGKAMYCDLIDKTTYTYDCQAAGMTCKVDSSSFSAICVGQVSGYTPLPSNVVCTDGRCTRTGQSCSKAPLNRCSGKQLQACLGGEWVLFDCAGLGLGDCELTTVGNSTWGRCRPTSY